MQKPENKYGYLGLTSANGKLFWIKASAINAIAESDDEGVSTVISFGSETGALVKENFSDLLEQLENIHPNLL